LDGHAFRYNPNECDPINTHLGGLQADILAGLGVAAAPPGKRVVTFCTGLNDDHCLHRRRPRGGIVQNAPLKSSRAHGAHGTMDSMGPMGPMKSERIPFSVFMWNFTMEPMAIVQSHSPWSPWFCSKPITSKRQDEKPRWDQPNQQTAHPQWSSYYTPVQNVTTLFPGGTTAPPDLPFLPALPEVASAILRPPISQPEGLRDHVLHRDSTCAIYMAWIVFYILRKWKAMHMGHWQRNQWIIQNTETQGVAYKHNYDL
jgi:hypothetical protein